MTLQRNWGASKEEKERLSVVIVSVYLLQCLSSDVLLLFAAYIYTLAVCSLIKHSDNFGLPVLVCFTYRFLGCYSCTGIRLY
jgi:hypothetical protein